MPSAWGIRTLWDGAKLAARLLDGQRDFAVEEHAFREETRMDVKNGKILKCPENIKLIWPKMKGQVLCQSLLTPGFDSRILPKLFFTNSTHSR
jgi:hypothetical protein